MKRAYYACRVRLNGADSFVIWYEDKLDGFVSAPDSRLVVASSRENLETAAQQLGLALTPGAATEYDFDRLRAWCDCPAVEGIECPTFLNAWNFFDDLAALHENPDSPFTQLSRSAAGSYDKLFWGSNLPSMTPPGERYVPAWDADELDAIRCVREAGLDLMNAELHKANAAS